MNKKEHESLDRVIADILRRLDALHEGRPAAGGASTGDDRMAAIFRDLEMFAAADPVLAALHKAFLDASAQHRILVARNGAGDPMTEVAADMASSCRSAVQTRMIELQDEREAEIRAALLRGLRARQAAHEAAVARMFIAQRGKRKADEIGFLLFIMYWIIMETIRATQERLSAAQDFAVACAMARSDRRQLAGC